MAVLWCVTCCPWCSLAASAPVIKSLNQGTPTAFEGFNDTLCQEIVDACFVLQDKMSRCALWFPSVWAPWKMELQFVWDVNAICKSVFKANFEQKGSCRCNLLDWNDGQASNGFLRLSITAAKRHVQCDDGLWSSVMWQWPSYVSELWNFRLAFPSFAAATTTIDNEVFMSTSFESCRISLSFALSSYLLSSFLPASTVIIV